MAKTQTPMLEAKGFLLGRLKGFVFYSHSHGVRSSPLGPALGVVVSSVWLGCITYGLRKRKRTRDAEEEKGRGVRSRSRSRYAGESRSRGVRVRSRRKM